MQSLDYVHLWSEKVNRRWCQRRLNRDADSPPAVWAPWRHEAHSLSARQGQCGVTHWSILAVALCLTAEVLCVWHCPFEYPPEHFYDVSISYYFDGVPAASVENI